MSHNPNTVKSQHEINEGGRKSDVLLSTIEELERTKKQLDIAIAGLQYYANEDIYIECHKVVNGNNEWASEVMLDNGVKASYFLKRIEELNKWLEQ